MKRNIDKLGKRCWRRVDMRPVRARRSNDLSGKMLAAVFTLMCVAMPVLCSADTPIAVSVFKTFPDHASVCGAHLSPIAVNGPDRVAGLSFGGINSLVTREVRGLQLSGIASWGHPDGPKETLVYGGQIAGAFTGTDQLVGIQVAGIFSGADDMTGIQLSGLSSAVGNHGIRGVQIAGLLAQSQTCAGLQMALWNGSESLCGVQVGLMNFAVPAENGFVIQIGLVNGIGRDEKAGWSGMRIIPIINASW